LTQNVSQFVYRQGFNGIRYLSKYGHDIENWALFEPANLTSQTSHPHIANRSAPTTRISWKPCGFSTWSWAKDHQGSKVTNLCCWPTTGIIL
jgi:hypothetical protein